MPRIEIGDSAYSVSRDGNPAQVGGDDRFVVVCSETGRPVLRHRDRTTHVSYPKRRAARATAHNLTTAGLPAKVYEK